MEGVLIFFKDAPMASSISIVMVYMLEKIC